MKQVARKSDKNKQSRHNSNEGPDKPANSRTDSIKEPLEAGKRAKLVQNIFAVEIEDLPLNHEENEKCDICVSIDSVFHHRGNDQHAGKNYIMQVVIPQTSRSDGISYTKATHSSYETALKAITQIITLNGEQDSDVCSQSLEQTEGDTATYEYSSEVSNEYGDNADINPSTSCEGTNLSKEIKTFNIGRMDEINHIYETINYIDLLCKSERKAKRKTKIPSSKSMDANVKYFSPPPEIEMAPDVVCEAEKMKDLVVEDTLEPLKVKGTLITNEDERDDLVPISKLSSDSVHTLDAFSQPDSKNVPSDVCVNDRDSSEDISVCEEDPCTPLEDTKPAESSREDLQKMREPCNGRVLFYGFRNGNKTHSRFGRSYHLTMNKELSPYYFGFDTEESFNNAINAPNEVIVKPPVTIGRSISFKCNMVNCTLPREQIIADAVLQMDWDQYRMKREKKSMWSSCCQV